MATARPHVRPALLRFRASFLEQDARLRLRHWIGPLSVLVPLLAACTGGERPRGAAGDAPADTSLAHDDFGASLASAAPAARIVSLNPTTTEILFTIGAGARVVGRTQYDVYPDAARRVPSLGAGIRPDVEAVLGAHPDLVVLYASADNRAAAQQLRALGIRVVAFKVDDIAGFRRVTRALGRLAGDSAAAAAVVDSVDATLRRVARATAPLPHPTVFVHTWDTPLLTIGRGSFMSELISIAGGRNLYDDLAAPSPAVTLENVVRRDPDIVLASPAEAARLRSAARWQAVGAVRAGRVLAYDTTLVARPSVTLGAAAVSLAGLLHPGVVAP